MIQKTEVTQRPPSIRRNQPSLIPKTKSVWMGSLDTQPLIRFGDDVIDHSFHVVGLFPYRQLPISPGAFVHDPFDVRHLALRAELDQFSIDAVARRAPAVFIQKTSPVDP